MKKLSLLLLVVACSYSSAHSDSTLVGWSKSFDLGLTATQSSYSDSWTGGDAGNVSWAANGNGVFSKQFTSHFNLRNTVKLAFGQTMSQDKDSKKWSSPAKSTDKIDIEALGLFTIHAFIEPFASVRMESQFLDASVDNHNRYVNPVLLTEAAGIAKQLVKKDKNDILTRLGFALRENIDRVLQPPDSTSTRTSTSTDGGIESVTDTKLVLGEKLQYAGKLTLYRAFYFSKKSDFAGTPQADYWKAIHVNWENGLVASISKYVQVTFYTQLLYDKLISKKGRLKQTLAMGLTYKIL